jgi:hypothetical protein
MSALPANPTIAGVNALKSHSLNRVLMGVPVGMGIGAGARGIVGLMDMLRRHTAPATPPMRRSAITVPVPGEEEEKIAAEGGLVDGLMNSLNIRTPASPATDAMTQKLLNAPPPTPTPKPGGAPSVRGPATGHSFGDHATKATDMPWFNAGLPLAIGGGLYGGYKLTDWLLGKTRRGEIDSELENAQADYEKALLTNAKTAAATELDSLASGYEKDASTTAGITAALALGSLLTAGGTGVMSYNWAKNQQRDSMLRKAYERRQRQMFARQPFPVRATAISRPPAAEEEQPKPARLGLKTASTATNSAADQFLARKQQEAQAAVQQSGSATKKVERPAAPKLPSLV